MNPKTIQIYLPRGNPKGIRVAEITTRIVQIIEVPRSLLNDFTAMRESRQVAVYFLFGDSEEGYDNSLYVGQTGDVGTRLERHNRKEGFWTRALIVISRTNSLTNTHSLFLEWKSIQAAQQAGRYAVKNGTGGSKPHAPAPLVADCEEILDTASVLLATLGYPVFDPVVPSKVSEDGEVFLCKSKDWDGRGMLTSEGFVVLKDSRGRREDFPSISPSMKRLRQRLIASGILKVDGAFLTFTKDHLFSSPSTAGSVLLGRSTNGWTRWKTAEGQTLDQVRRQ